MWVRRLDGNGQISLRKTPKSRGTENMLPNASVAQGDFVVVLHYDKEFCLVLASCDGIEKQGYLETAYLTAAMVQASDVRRTTTLLCKEPDRQRSRTNDCISVTNGELVGVLGQEQGFLFIRTQSGATGFIEKSDLKRMDWVRAGHRSATFFLQPVDV